MGATNYNVTDSTGAILATGSSSPITILGLTSGTSYMFGVTAINAGGTSSVVWTPYITTPPSTPTGVYATVDSSISAHVYFDSQLGATMYTVTSTPGSITADGDSTPVLVTGLSPNTSYTFTVKATNAGGDSISSSPSSSIITPPSAPTEIVATVSPPSLYNINSSVNVSFTHSTDVTDYMVTASGYGYDSNNNYTGPIGTYFAYGSSSPIDISYLRPSTSYTFTVTATNANGSSTSVASSASLTSPHVPGGVQAILSDINSATVSFIPNNTDIRDGPDATTYTVTSSPHSLIATGTSSPLVVTGLSPNTTYSFTVIASNTSGSSLSSNQSNSVITAPSAPTEVSATALSSSSARIIFTEMPGAQRYMIDIISSSSRNSVQVFRSPAEVYDLLFSASYTFTVSSINVGGSSIPSSESNSITTFPDVPSAPTGVSAQSVQGENSIDVFFQTSYGATRYTIYAYESSSVSEVGTIDGLSSPIRVSGLRGGTLHIFKVSAINATGPSALSIESNEIITSPSPPINVVPTVESSTSVIVSFTLSTGATSYTVSPLGGLGGLPVFSGTTSPITVTDLLPNTSYSFIVRAINSSGFNTSNASTSITTPSEEAPPSGGGK